jgi:carboxyl-terminal processing protease
MTAEEYENEIVSLTGNYSGIGVTFSMDTSNNFVILAVTAGSPAEEAGILPGDYIVKVNGETFGPDEFNTIATKIRGESGTQVTLTILRGSNELEFTMTRRKISTQSVSYEMKDGETGYIYISSFEQNTGTDFKKALKSLEKSGAKYLVVDIRDNPGGLVNSAVQVADELMGKGTVVYIQDQAGNREYYTTEAGRTKLPYVLLVNENSASSSEILAAGIQDNNEGTIVGTLTFGKGIIQGMQELTDGSAFRMTEYQYFSPNGSVIHKKGITPDYIVEFEDGDLDEDGHLVYDRQLERAIEILKSGK